MGHCEHCNASDADKEIRLSDTAPDTWLCQECFELNPHHSDWDSLKKKPYHDYIEMDLKVSMNKEAIEFLIELIDEKIPRDFQYTTDADLENNSINDIDDFRNILQRTIEEHEFGTGANEVQIE